MGHSCGTLLSDTLVGHSCGTLFSQKSTVTSPERAFRTRRPPKVTCQVYKTSISHETCHKNIASTQRPETPIPMSQSHPTTPKHHSPNATPNVTTQKTADLTKRCACAVKSSSILQHLTFPHDSSLFHTNLTRHPSIQNPLQKLPPMAAP